MLGKRIHGTPIVPVTAKIGLIFALFVLVSNLATNYLNLMYNRTILNDQMLQLLAKDLKEIYAFCNSQYDIFELSGDRRASQKSIEQKGLHELRNEKSILLGVGEDGSIMFHASREPRMPLFSDSEALSSMVKSAADPEKRQGLLRFNWNKHAYLGMFKYNAKWGLYILRGEQRKEFYRQSRIVYVRISWIILGVSFCCALVGVLVMRHVLRYMNALTSSILQMITNKELGTVDLSKAPNDDITFLGAAFNTLSSSVSNLLHVFTRFANQDTVDRAYQELDVRLEGKQEDLAIMFCDIKGFTTITETLGLDIITLLNLYYDRTIRMLVEHDGLIATIIGDAVLSVFGALEGTEEGKSRTAILCGYRMHSLAAKVRDEMRQKREEIVREKGKLTEEEERVYHAVQIDVGVGIDRGQVFRGNIGSWVRMANTVIGDSVNSAARLEGLTRIYDVPVICSESVKEDVESTSVTDHGIRFVEMDRVRVKGKTEAAKIYWPIPMADDVLFDGSHHDMVSQLDTFATALQLYYDGKWQEAHERLSRCTLPFAKVFQERTATGKCPDDWSGVWTLKSK